MTDDILPPILFPSKNKTQQAWMTKLKKSKRIRAAGPRLYVSVAPDRTESAIRASWVQIVSQLFPKAMLSHRTALEYLPTTNGDVYLTATTNRTIRYPGLTLHFHRGPAALKNDDEFLGLQVSSFARALLENLSGNKAGADKCLSTSELEKKLEKLLHLKGRDELNSIRNQARIIAKKLDWKKEFTLLDQMIGALLGTQPATNFKSAEALARANGRPFDTETLQRLNLLFAQLKQEPLPALPDTFKNSEHKHNKAFFEAYFSNYIEGTIFEIEEAEEIVFDKKIPEKRAKDGHDILQTFNLISDPKEMKRIPKNSAELEDLLKSRHAYVLANRPDVEPGHYKTRPNRAGDTHFVHPDLVGGTLDKGYELYTHLPAGLARAAFIMFLVAEVHPFKDGNGRIARIMMNAELVAEKLTTVIIPAVYREDYLSALRALSRRDRPDPLIRMLIRAQKFSNLEFAPYKKTLTSLEEQNWFSEPSEAKLID